MSSNPLLFRALFRLCLFGAGCWPALSAAQSLPSAGPVSQPTSQPASQESSPRAPESLPASPPATAPASAPASVPAPVAAPVEEGTLPDGVWGLEVRGVSERAPLTAASSSLVRARDFLLRPLPRPADILMLVPGLFVAQHAGGGKANQYFLRGFDADHGTDVLLMVDGVPANMVSHGHGQGYADLHFVIPELIETLEVAKGPYFAEHGDFATAGAFNMVTRRRVEESSLSLAAGGFASPGRALSTARSLVITSPTVGSVETLLAGEAYTTNGPFENAEGLIRYNLFGKATRPLENGGAVSLSFSGYSAGWNASGQLPEREIEAGRLDPFGFIDPTEGGSTQRNSLRAAYDISNADGDLQLMGYLTQYRFRLYSNFTFFSRDPNNGDQIEQTDDRTTAGVKGSYRFTRRILDRAWESTIGLELRSDRIDNGLFTSAARERLAPTVDADISQASFALYAREEVALLPWLRAVLGLRGDYFGFDVNDRLEDLSSTGGGTSGVAQDFLLSPKLSLIASLRPDLSFFANAGYGYHSNDARGAVRQADPVTPLSPALGGELGLRALPWESLELALVAFFLALDSETVWVGDEGVTEANGPTLRRGLELETRARLLPWLFADLDATLTEGTFVQNAGNADAIALAPRVLVSGGLSARHPSGLSGRLGVYHIGDRPATEDEFLIAQGFTRLDLSGAYRVGRLELGVDIQNLLNTSWREAQFANVSRLASETDASACPSDTRAVEEGGVFIGCEDVHFTPGAPLNALVTLSWYF